MIMRTANRNPDRFPDPDLLDVGRQSNKHLAFGWGIHFCSEAPLAPIEARQAIRTVLDRLPAIRLLSPEVVWSGNMSLSCPQTLPVAFRSPQH